MRNNQSSRGSLLWTLLWATGCAVPLLAGCASVKGHWNGRDVKPEMARDQISFFRPTGQTGNFVEADLRLQSDKTYVAEVNYGGKVTTFAGTWKFKKQTLNFTGSDGQPRVASARLKGDKTLEITESIKGTQVVLTLEKQKK